MWNIPSSEQDINGNDKWHKTIVTKSVILLSPTKSLSNTCKASLSEFQVETSFMSESDDLALSMLNVSVFANPKSINLICLKYSHSPNRRSAKWTVMDDIIWSILDVHRPNAGLKYPFENTKAGIPVTKSLSV